MTPIIILTTCKLKYTLTTSTTALKFNLTTATDICATMIISVLNLKRGEGGWRVWRGNYMGWGVDPTIAIQCL